MITESFYNMVLFKAYQKSLPKYKTALYKKFNSMKTRCYQKNDKHYYNYGGRGITVCKEWLDDYGVFLRDLEESYFEHVKIYGRKNTTLDRIDNDKGYSKENCRWATKKEQQNNIRRNVKYTYKGETKNITEWSTIHNIKIATLLRRIKLGWTEDNIFSKTSKHRDRLLKPRQDNTSGVIGVTYNKSRNKWQSFLIRKFIGRYDTFEEAVYNRFLYEIKTFGCVESEKHITDEKILKILKSAKDNILGKQ